MIDVLIVGSGPSSYAFLSEAIKNNNLNITLIDNSDLDFSKHEGCMFRNSNFKNSRLGSNTKIIDTEIIDSDDSVPYPSKVFGGFSNVWGGTLDSIPTTLFESLKNEGIDIRSEFNKIVKNLKILSLEDSVESNFIKKPEFVGIKNYKNFINKSTILETTFSQIIVNDWVTVDTIDNKICKYCRQFEWACNNNLIWDTKSYIKNLISLNKINYLKNTKLISFIEEKTTVKVTIQVDNKSLIKSFNKVIIATGPIATSSIMIESNIINDVEIKSSDLVVIPFLKYFITSNKKDSYPDLFLRFRIEDLNYFCQLYFFSNGVLKLSFINNLFKKIVGLIPKFFMNFSGGLFLYLDESISSKFIVKKDGNQIKYLKVDKQLNNLLIKTIRNIFLENKIILILKLKVFKKFGSSYHYGGQFPHKKINNSISSDRLGRVGKLKNVHIVDSSVLPHISAGTLTICTMSNSLRIAKELFNKN
jgi:hypothetical protein